MPHSFSRSGLTLLAASLTLAGCGGANTPNPNLPRGPAAYEAIPVTAPEALSYTIAPRDVLTLTVFNEPDLTIPRLRVDDVGYVQVPLAGQIKASGLSAEELAQAIAARLGGRYIVNPQVTVSVLEVSANYVTVEGEVKQPGVFPIDDKFTLLSAIARAQSPTVTAKLNEVVVLRTINGKHMAARFDLRDLRSGVAPDPQLLGGDVVTVGFSPLSGAWQDLLKAAPLFNTFVYLSRN